MLKKLLAVVLAALPLGCSAAQQIINVGTPDSGTGDTLRSAFVKVNTNFTELFEYTANVEMFGAVADDGLDDYAAITNALATTGKAVLGAGRYDLSRRLELVSNQQLIGAGMRSTTLRLMDNIAEYAAIPTNAPASKYQVVMSSPPSTNVTVAAMTVDANMAGQANTNWAVHYPAMPSKPITMGCVLLRGGGQTLLNVKAIGWGAGGVNHFSDVNSTNYSECFPLLVTDAGVDPALVNSGAFPRGLVTRVSGCEVTTPCYDYSNYELGFPGADASMIVAHINYGQGVVENNRIYDVGLTDTVNGSGWSEEGMLLGITLYGTNLIARDNLIQNFYGTGLWVGDSFTNRNIIYANNVVDGARVGFRIKDASSSSYSGFNDLSIVGNRFRNYGDVPAGWRTLPKTPGKDGNDVQLGFDIGSYFNITNLYVANNEFTMSGWDDNGTERQAVIGDIYPLAGATYAAWKFHDNYMSSEWQGDYANSASRVDWTRDNVGLNSAKVSFVNNRDAEGGTAYIRDRLAGDFANNAYRIDNTYTLRENQATNIITPATGTHTLLFDSGDDYLKYKKDTGGLYKLVHTQPDGNTLIDGRISMLGNQPVKWGEGLTAAGIAAGTTNDYIGLSLGWNGNHHALLDIINVTNTAWSVRSPGYVNNSGDTNGVFSILVNSDGTKLQDNHGKLTFVNNTYHSGDANLQNNDITNIQNMAFTPGPMMISASGTPEASVTAPVGSLYLRSDGGAGTSLYVKESGTGNTGWTTPGLDHTGVVDFGGTGTITNAAGIGTDGVVTIFGSASKPALLISDDKQVNSLGIILDNFGVSKINFNPYGLRFYNGATIEWGPGSAHGASDLFLARDASGTLAQRNFANAQTSRIYGSYSDASNFSRISVSHDGSSTGVVAVESAGTGSANQSLALKVAGNGALYVDGATPGGARGVNAVDLQIFRTSSAHKASGSYSAILGGQYNVASGGASVVVSGLANSASGLYSSSIGGAYASAYLYGQHAYASGRFAANGDAQGSRLVAYGTTSGTTPADLFLDGSSAKLVLPNNTTWKFVAEISARSTDAGTGNEESGAWEISGLIERDSAAADTRIVGTPTVTTIAEDDAAWSVAASADTVSGALTITCTGNDETTVRWVAVVRLVEVGG